MLFTSSLKGLLLTHQRSEGEGEEEGEGEYEEGDDEENSFASRTLELSSSLPPNKNEKAAHTRTTVRIKNVKEEEVDNSIEQQLDNTNKNIEGKGMRKGKVGKRGREEEEEDEIRSVTSLVEYSSNPSTSTSVSPIPSTSVLPRQLAASRNIRQADKMQKNFPQSRLNEKEVEVEVDDDAYLDSFVMDDEDENENEDEKEDIEVEEIIDLIKSGVLQGKTKKSNVAAKMEEEEEEEEDEVEVDEDFNDNFKDSFSFSNSQGEGFQRLDTDLSVVSAKKSRNLGSGSEMPKSRNAAESKKRNVGAARGEIAVEEEEQEEEEEEDEEGEDSYSGDFDVSR